jgi:hypothetical protein
MNFYVISIYYVRQPNFAKSIILDQYPTFPQIILHKNVGEVKKVLTN